MRFFCFSGFCYRVFFLLVMSVFSAAISVKAQSLPSVDFILGKVWANMEMQPFELDGVIRHANMLHPLKLKTGSREMIYLFGREEPQVKVSFFSDAPEIYTRKDDEAKWTRLPVVAWDRPILGSDITYRDLALDFLTWPEVRLVGRANAKTLPAFVLETVNPAGSDSPISKVRYWVSSEHFVLVQAEAYNSHGEVIRRFDVNGVQRFGDFWTIKELRIAEMIPKRNISRSRTFIEINSGKPIVAK